MPTSRTGVQSLSREQAFTLWPIVKHLSETLNARPGLFTEIEIRSVISHLPDQDLTVFAYITGMRKGEVQSLRWLDVHGDAITLRAENSKNKEGRTIVLEGEAQ